MGTRRLAPLPYHLAVAAVDELRLAYPEVPSLDGCDRSKLESALLQPFQSVVGNDAYPGNAAKTAALMYFLVKSHACWTGAKRVAATLTLAVLAWNDCWLTASPDELASVVIGLAESDSSQMYAAMHHAEMWVASRLECQSPAHLEF